MSFLDKIRICNRWNPDDYGYFYTQDGQLLGRPKKSFIALLLENYPDIFEEVAADSCRLHLTFKTLNARTQAVAGALLDIQQKYHYFPLWRDELWRASLDFNEHCEFYVERGCVAYFGVKAWGIHVNGYVRKKDGLHMWVAKRAANKAAWPGLLDQIVGGGQPANLSPMENVLKESAEEANIPPALAAKAQDCGILHYMVDWNGLHNDVMFVFDLELPESFIPHPVDGEVESFTLMPIEDVANLVDKTTQYKDNSALVVIDFLIRHGYLNESHHEFKTIKQMLYHQ